MKKKFRIYAEQRLFGSMETKMKSSAQKFKSKFSRNCRDKTKQTDKICLLRFHFLLTFCKERREAPKIDINKVLRAIALTNCYCLIQSARYSVLVEYD
jgi:hypothetical protein